MKKSNERIHGYNAIYYNNAAPRFHSFDLVNKRPTNFINRQVSITSGENGILDHQGHIVPQNMLDLIVDPLIKEMGKCTDEDAVKNFINAQKNTYPWLQLVYDYGKQISDRTPMFDFDENDPEEKLRGFFSIVIWNPVNICRAPEDSRRNNYPVDKIDDQVATYLSKHTAEQGVHAAWLLSLQTLIANKDNKKTLNDYINECCKTLSEQEKSGFGYYSFPWKKDSKGVLFPDN
ncbi:hypothetical protein [Chryseobacterium viscerum]|uniref:Uncharacterized protein n=1 Tax=Chryseobacterium viscerum TaxID=1037377 RepID=A0A316WIP6_9FLAO|nr:hypothetical protein [Chryseobacterium viscerum]PWN61244.1 hypothetical protein C1634_014405 [Chryseobacterium viscerum]